MSHHLSERITTAVCCTLLLGINSSITALADESTNAARTTDGSSGSTPSVSMPYPLYAPSLRNVPSHPELPAAKSKKPKIEERAVVNPKNPASSAPASSNATTNSAAHTFSSDPETELREATEILKRKSKNVLENALAYERRGAAYTRLQKWDLAIKELNEAIKLDPLSPTAWASRGLSYYKLGHDQEALRDLNKAIQLNPKLAAAYACRANVYMDMEKYQLAWKDAQQAVKLDPKDPYNQITLGRAAHYVGQSGMSIAACSKAIAKNPKNPLGWDNRGVEYLRIKNYQKAIADFTMAIKLNPHEAKYYCHRGIVYCEIGNYDQAIKDLSMAIKLRPDYSLALFDRGVSYYRMGKYELALEDIKMAIHFDPHYALAWYVFPLDPTKVPKHTDKMDEAKDWYFRAVTTILLQRNAESMGDLKKYLELAGWQGEYSQRAALLIYFNYLRFCQNAEAKAVLDEAATKCDKTKWPYPIISYLKGEITEDQLLQQSKSQETGSRPEKETEARSCIALDHWYNSRREKAQPHMDWIKINGYGEIVTYSLVLREMEKTHEHKTKATERYYEHPLHDSK